jgi:hypothetical protein
MDRRILNVTYSVSDSFRTLEHVGYTMISICTRVAVVSAFDDIIKRVVYFVDD